MRERERERERERGRERAYRHVLLLLFQGLSIALIRFKVRILKGIELGTRDNPLCLSLYHVCTDHSTDAANGSLVVLCTHGGVHVDGSCAIAALDCSAGDTGQFVFEIRYRLGITGGFGF
jgi:hypothetical protein